MSVISEVDIIPEEKVHQTWTRVTGKPWDDAHKDGFSDGGYDTNIELQKKLTGGWNPYPDGDATSQNNNTKINDAAAGEAIENTTIPENTTTTENQQDSSPVSVPDESSNKQPIINNADDFYKYIGYDKIPERKVIDNEKRIKRLTKRKNLSGLGEAFKLLVEAGGAEFGSYVDKREPNKYMTQTEKKIQELYDSDMIEHRRVENQKINDAIRNAGDYGKYRSQQDAYGQQDKNREDAQVHQSEMQDSSQTFRSGERDKDRTFTEGQTDKKLAHDITQQSQAFTDRKELQDDAQSHAISIEERREALRERIAWIGEVTDDEFAEYGAILERLAGLSEEEQMNLLPWVQNLIAGIDKPNDNQIKALVNAYKSTDEATSEVNKADFQQGTEPLDEEAETPGSYWNGETNEETDIYGNPL